MAGSLGSNSIMFQTITKMQIK